MTTDDNVDPVVPTPVEEEVPPSTTEVDPNSPDTDRPILTDYTIIVETLTGTVKWFNNKAGFGFITVCEPGDYKDKDIFVHYSSIRVSNSQYKYLVQGEYVDFTLVKANSDTHEFQAMNVSGVKGGPIMCEIRRSLTTPPPDTRASYGRGDDYPSRRGPAYRSEGPQRPQRETRPPLDSNNRRPRRQPAPSATPRETVDGPTTSITGEDMLGFTKVVKKRSRARPPAHAHA
jgi:cold shock CspA family protein